MQNPVLILGASGGIGGAIARELARQGHELVVHGRRSDRLAALVGSLEAPAETEIADLADEAAVRSMFARIAGAHGSLAGVVFSVAAPFQRRLAHRMAWSEFERQIDTQLKALHLVAAAAFPLLADKAQTTRLIVIGSEAVLGVPEVKMAGYVAAKAAVTAYARALAREWVKRGVRVHIAAPGLVRTDLVSDLPDAWLDNLAEKMPEGKLTTVDDVARMVSFLMTDSADCLYGAPLQVSRSERR